MKVSIGKLEALWGSPVRRNRAEYPPKAGEKAGSLHDCLMVIFRQPGEEKFRAAHFDNEGHVIR